MAMSNVISGTDYVYMAGNFASAKTYLSTVKDFMYDNVYQVVMTQEVLPSYDLVKDLYDSYITNSTLSGNNSTFQSGVRAINRHVLTRGGFANLDDYLDSLDGSVTVTQTWADLCASVGYPITNDGRTRISG